MSDQQELGTGASGDGETSQGQSQSSATTTTTRQPNWNEDPAFRELQSKMDQRLSYAERRAQEEAQQRQYLEQQIHEMRMQGMDESQKLMYQNQLLQQQLVSTQRQRDLDALAIQRQRDLDDISRKTGAPVSALEDSPTVHDAWQRAYDWREKNAGTAAAPSKPVNDVVDMGGGKPTTTSSRLQAKYDEARKAYNIREQLEAMAEADAEGVTLKEW